MLLLLHHLLREGHLLRRVLVDLFHRLLMNLFLYKCLFLVCRLLVGNNHNKIRNILLCFLEIILLILSKVVLLGFCYELGLGFVFLFLLLHLLLWMFFLFLLLLVKLDVFFVRLNLLLIFLLLVVDLRLVYILNEFCTYFVFLLITFIEFLRAIVNLLLVLKFALTTYNLMVKLILFSLKRMKVINFIFQTK